jgi:WD40 repeat protein
LEGHTGHVLAVGWKNDSTTLASAGADLTVKFWDTSTGEKRKQAGGFEREVTGVVFLKDDQWLATGHPRELRVVNENGDRVGVVRIWDRDTEAPRLQFPPPPSPVAAAAP